MYLALAGLTVALDTDSADMAAFCRDYLSEHTAASADFTVSVSEADIRLERTIAAQECAYEGIPPISYTDAELTRTAFYRKIAEVLPRYGAVVFHGSVVAVDGHAYCFTAKSGVGKTTHTRLWTEHIPGAFMVNGDKPILRLTEGGLMACGTPWAGKEGLQRNVCVPLKAIAVLERGAENHIDPCSFRQIYPLLLQQCYRPRHRDGLRETMAFLSSLGQQTALYRMTCNRDAVAAQIAYDAMRPHEEGEKT